MCVFKVTVQSEEEKSIMKQIRKEEKKLNKVSSALTKLLERFNRISFTTFKLMAYNPFRPEGLYGNKKHTKITVEKSVKLVNL